MIIESIKIYGHDLFYMPRVINNKDEVYGADDVSSYEQTFMVEMYIKSINGFEGDGNFFSKFAGVEIRDTVVFTLARRTFQSEVGRHASLERPRESDLLFFPMNSRIFEIKYVDYKPFFYQLGGLQTWELHCEFFEYSNERFSTGIPEIDAIQTTLTTNIFDYSLLTQDSLMILTEHSDYIVSETGDLDEVDPLADNDPLQTQSDSFLDFTETDPFVERPY